MSTPAQKLNHHPPAQNTNSARIWKKYSRIPYNHSETPILLGFGRNTAEYLTITPKHQYAPPARDINQHRYHSQHHTSTIPPIICAGSDWERT